MSVRFIWSEAQSLEVGDAFWWEAMDTYHQEPLIVGTIRKGPEGVLINEVHACTKQTRVVVRLQGLNARRARA